MSRSHLRYFNKEEKQATSAGGMCGAYPPPTTTTCLGCFSSSKKPSEVMTCSLPGMSGTRGAPPTATSTWSAVTVSPFTDTLRGPVDHSNKHEGTVDGRTRDGERGGVWEGWGGGWEWGDSEGKRGRPESETPVKD